MSKKSKKKRTTSNERVTQSSPQPITAVAPVTSPAATSATKQYAFRSKNSTEFNPDYGYVKKDLKRIGIMAGSFFIILIALTFFLR